MADADAPAAKPKTNWLILVVLALAQFMLIVDVTIVNIALPSIQREFAMTDASLQWVLTAYALTFGGFLLLGGRSADYFGRRRTFLAGLTVFTLASLGSGLAHTGTWLVVFRAIQGLAGAYMSPAALSTVLVTYKEGNERNIALSVWGAIAAAGGALGVLLGGVLTQYLSWRWNFFVNVPIGVLVFAATLMLVPDGERMPGRRHLDIPGALLVTGGLMALVYGFVKAPDWGWTDHRTLIWFGGSLLALIGFVVNEALTRYPLMPLNIFRVRNVAGADLTMMLVASGVFSSFFILTLYVQDLLHYSPIRNGISFLLFPAFIALAATNVPRLVKRIGYKPIMVAGPMLMASGLFLESGLPVGGHYWTNVAPGMVLMALGMGSTIVSTTIAATSGVAREESGLASGLLTTAQQIGAALGLALITAILTSSTTDYLQSLTSGTRPTPPLILAATVHGFEQGLLVAGFLALAAAACAFIVIKPAAPQPVAATAGPERPPAQEAPEAAGAA